MKKLLSLSLVVAVGLVLALSADSFAASKDPTGFLGSYAKQLKPGPEGGVQMRWIKPGIDFSKYDKVMLDSVVFYFAPDSKDKGIDPELMKELSDAFNLELVNALKDKYPIVSEPGPDVIRIKIALTGIKQSRPVLSAISSITPPGIVISTLKKGTTGSWAGSGATGAELLAIDTMNEEVIGAAQDMKTAGFTERFSKYGSANEAFKFWAGRLKMFLDQAHGVKDAK
jgi:hypothetical protein